MTLGPVTMCHKPSNSSNKSMVQVFGKSLHSLTAWYITSVYVQISADIRSISNIKPMTKPVQETLADLAAPAVPSTCSVAPWVPTLCPAKCRKRSAAQCCLQHLANTISCLATWYFQRTFCIYSRPQASELTPCKAWQSWRKIKTT